VHFESWAKIRGTHVGGAERDGEPQQREQQEWTQAQRSATRVRSFSLC
jgi:hypothetical protein